MKPHPIYSMSFGSIYPHYVTKVEKKGKSVEDLHRLIHWLTGYEGRALDTVISDGTDMEGFFAKAPSMNPNRSLIKGVICGHRVEDIEEPVMREIRYLDKLVDELARGKKMESILRS